MIQILFFLLISMQASAADWLDQSHEVFLTKKLNAVTSRYREFPMFWWNFVIIDGNLSPQSAESFCQDLEKEWRPALLKLPCRFSPENLSALTTDWVHDLYLRRAVPSAQEWNQQMNSILIKAAMPLPRSLLDLLRTDPLNTLNELKQKLDQRKIFDLPLRGGQILAKENSERWIPLQLDYSPADSQRTKELMVSLQKICEHTEGCKSVHMFGPHFSALENETRVRDDIEVVSLAGTISLVLLVAFVLITRRYKIVWLMPILLIGLSIAAAVTVLVFGKIHGITLAFGPGIVGLAMDYGVHAVFMDPRSRSTWKSNLAGLLTTLVILIILIFSEIPLLRQMMFFSAFGLVISFALFYVFLHLWPSIFETAPYEFSPKTWLAGEYFAIAMLAAAGLIILKPLDLSIQHLNYESPRSVAARSWFGRHTTSLQPYLIEESSHDPLSSAHKTKKWAEEQNISYEGIANFLPAQDEQSKNLTTWTSFCDKQFIFTSTQTRFFAPFLDKFPCQELKTKDPRLNAPDYIKDFSARESWASLLFPTDNEQVKKVKDQFAEAITPREIFPEFPRIFIRELSWMVPIAFLSALLFLFWHFRSLGFTLLAIVPFLTGLGCYAAIAVAFDLPLSFISLIGLLMVFGFSLDYGIFVVDLLREHSESKFGVWSALTLCSFSTLAGFAPLIFAGHPVLNDLGQTLLWGSFGTYVGTFWGIPGLYRRIYA